MEHQGSRRIGPPQVVTDRKGFILIPAAGWIIIGGIVYMTAMFWAWVISSSCMDCTFRGVGSGGSF